MLSLWLEMINMNKDDVFLSYLPLLKCYSAFTNTYQESALSGNTDASLCSLETRVYQNVTSISGNR